MIVFLILLAILVISGIIFVVTCIKEGNLAILAITLTIFILSCSGVAIFLAAIIDSQIDYYNMTLEMKMNGDQNINWNDDYDYRINNARIHKDDNLLGWYYDPMFRDVNLSSEAQKLKAEKE